MRRIHVGNGTAPLWRSNYGKVLSALVSGPLRLRIISSRAAFGSLPKDIFYLGNGPDNMSAFTESQSQKEAALPETAGVQNSLK
jgi:hypothetical protein